MRNSMLDIFLIMLLIILSPVAVIAFVISISIAFLFIEVLIDNIKGFIKSKGKSRVRWMAKYDWKQLEKEYILGDYKSVSAFLKDKEITNNAYTRRNT